MKKPTKNPFTGKTDTHTYKLENKANDVTVDEFKKTQEINDGGTYDTSISSLALIASLMITPYKSENTVLHTRKNLFPLLKSDGRAESEIPVGLAA